MKQGIKASLFLIFIFLISIVGGIFGSEIVGPLLIKRPLYLKYSLEPTPVQIIEKKEIKIDDENSAKKVKKFLQEQEKKLIDELAEMVVIVKGKGVQAPGLVLASGSESLILCPAVFPPKIDLSVFFENKEAKAKIIKSDKDFILLKIQEKNLKTPAFFEKESFKPGERVFFLSKKMEKERVELILDEGLVSNFNEDFVQTNLKVRDFGFLFTQEGKFLGLVTKKEGKFQILSSKRVENFYRQ